MQRTRRFDVLIIYYPLLLKYLFMNHSQNKFLGIFSLEKSVCVCSYGS
jgi:hypothetical protein